MALRNYVGNAKATTIAGSDLLVGATSVVVANADNWPATNFWVAFERGTASEEKALCTTRTGTTLTIVRAQDDTIAAVHVVGSAVEHVGTATDLREANTLVNLPDAKGDVAVSTAVDAWGKVTAAGVANNVLVEDPTTATGWKSAASGGGHVVKDEGVALAARAGLNFVGDSVVATDDAAGNETDVAVNHPATPVHTSAQPHTVRKAGATIGTRPAVNFIDGSGITITVVDDAANGEVDVTVAGSSAAGHAIEDEGVALTNRPVLNFVGDGVVATDDAAGNETDVTVDRLVSIRKAGATVGTRKAVNFIDGTGVTATVVDDAANNEVDVTLASSCRFDSATVATNETTTSATYTDLTTAGPAVTLTLPAGAKVKVTLTAKKGTSGTLSGLMGFAISGANTVAAADAEALFVPVATGPDGGLSAVYVRSALAAGSTTFTAKYRAFGSTSAFADRTIIVEVITWAA